MLPTLCLCLCSLCEARQGWLTSVMLTTGQCRCPYEASNIRGVGWGWDIAFLGVYHFEPHFEVFKEKLRYQRTVRAFKKTSIRCLNVWSGKEEGRQTIYHLLFKFISLSLSLFHWLGVPIEQQLRGILWENGSSSSKTFLSSFCLSFPCWAVLKSSTF